MKIKVYFALFIAIFISCVFWFIQTSFARTTVSIGETSCAIDVKVMLALYGAGATQELADKWAKGAKSLLSGNGRTAGECKCKVDFDVSVIVVDEKAKCPKNTHCVEVKDIPPDSWRRSSVTSQDWSMIELDHQIDSGTGEWDNQDDATVAAHEIGHLLGLDDEYEEVKDKNGKVISINCKGRSDSIMCRSDLNTSVFYPEHIDKIIKGSGISCPDRCCCGNNIVDSSKGEACDPTGSKETVKSAKCGSYEKKCDSKCQWEDNPPTCCGDGAIQKPNSKGQTEQCEIDKDCQSQQYCCPDTCTCQTKTTTTR